MTEEAGCKYIYETFLFFVLFGCKRTCLVLNNEQRAIHSSCFVLQYQTKGMEILHKDSYELRKSYGKCGVLRDVFCSTVRMLLYVELLFRSPVWLLGLIERNIT
jgi:hypothetical protein